MANPGATEGEVCCGRCKVRITVFSDTQLTPDYNVHLVIERQNEEKSVFSMQSYGCIDQEESLIFSCFALLFLLGL